MPSSIIGQVTPNFSDNWAHATDADLTDRLRRYRRMRVARSTPAGRAYAAAAIASIRAELRRRAAGPVAA